MFDPEKLLKGMMTSGFGKGMKKKMKKGFKGGSGFGIGSTAKTAIGMGALGVAIAAFDHFVSKRNAPGGSAAGWSPQTGGQPQSGWQGGPSHGHHPGQYPGQQQGGYSHPGHHPAQPPGQYHQAPQQSWPTHPQGGGPSTPPPPPPAGSPPPPQTAPSAGSTPQPAAEPGNPGAVTLIRAMIASAYADGILDGNEREGILARLEDVNLSNEERQFITRELLSPANMDDIVKEANTPELAQQVYAVSLLAIDVDTETERHYLKTLASKLNLDGDTVRQIHAELEVDPIQ